MNYKPNKIEWQPGQLVVHDADAKTQKMLMKVLANQANGLIITEYISEELKEKYKKKNKWINRKEVLHHPALFNIDLEV